MLLERGGDRVEVVIAGFEGRKFDDDKFGLFDPPPTPGGKGALRCGIKSNSPPCGIGLLLLLLLLFAPLECENTLGDEN